MIDNECNILSNLTKFEFQQLRSLMIEMVLSTGIKTKQKESMKLDLFLLPFLQTCPHISHN